VRRTAPSNQPANIGLEYFWIILNSMLVALSFAYGYSSMTPDKLRHTNPEPILCLILLLITPLFAVGSVMYSITRWKTAPLSRPSWNRNPFDWWHDPLQSLFVSTCVMAAMAIGSAVQRPGYGSVGFWTTGVYCCFAIGLLVGQIVAYRIYREYIKRWA
jgi:hypothetical protein